MLKEEICLKNTLKIMIKTESKKPDFVLLGIVIALVLLGILILASVSAPVAQRKSDSSFQFLVHQLGWGLLPGLILGYLAFKIDMSWFKKYAPLFLFVNIILLILVLLPKIGGNAGGTSRWLDLKFFTIQPSEFLKLTLILYWASWWDSQKAKVLKNQDSTLYVFFTVMIFVGTLIFLQPDVGTLFLISIISGIIYLLADAPNKHIIIMLVLFLLIAVFLMKIAPYRSNRLAVFFNQDLDPMGLGYQIKQSEITIGSGGLFGTGIGLSQQKFGFLPELISDSIFSIFAEETGFLGSFILISLFTILFVRGIQIAMASKDKFAMLTASGISCWIAIQAIINIGAMTRLVPVTGMPLPFISYGGSALVSELIGIGILLNISSRAKL